MKTGELYVEQVLIGALVSSIMLAPWLPELREAVKTMETAAVVAAGSIAIAIAFWIGIPFDRLADSLSERLDQHNRLRFALRHADPAVWDGKRFQGDIFPEDRRRIESLRASEGALSWIEYHRSRIRLARGMALYGPALTLSLSLGVLRLVQPKALSSTAILPCLFGIALSYALWTVLANMRSSLPRVQEKLPRTNEEAVIEYARRWQGVDEKQKCFKKADTWDVSVWVAEWRLLLVPVAMLAVAFWVAVRNYSAEALGVVFAGIVVTTLSAWTWWRISITYRTYLHDLFRFSGS